MKKLLATTALLGLGVSAAQAVQARYFLSLQGLSDGGNTDSAAVPAANASDLNIDVGLAPTTTRLYLWAQIGLTPPTDLKGFDLAFRTTGNLTISHTNIWQNNFIVPGFARWNVGGVPGADSIDANPGILGPGAYGTNFVNVSPTVAVLEPGVTNGAFAGFDDQWVGALGAALVGYVEVSGNNGDVHIVNEGSGFLQIDPGNRVLLGLDDVTGNPAEVPNAPYDNASPEATITPEPASLALLGLAAVFGLRRR